MKFLKMHGCGNDFVVLDARHEAIAVDAARATAIADRRFGIGCDQIVLLSPSDHADIRMEIVNADGSRVSTCGNASRCVVDLLATETGKSEIAIETDAGIVTGTRTAFGEVAVAMGAPALHWRDIPLAEEHDILHLDISHGALTDPAAVSMGNPHMVFFVEELDAVAMVRDAAPLETHPLFPQRVNISAIQLLNPSHIRMKVWERGAGETLACGSAACAALVAAVQRGLCERDAVVDMPGGRLHIRWQTEDEGGQVVMRGPVNYVFDGNLL
jgi:diaminopimelate epimerase